MSQVHGFIVGLVADPVIVLDSTNRVVELNQAAQQLTGLANAEAVGSPAEWFWPSWGEPWISLCAAESLCQQVQWDTGGETLSFDARVGVLRDDEGRFAYRVIVLHDVSEQQRLDHSLRELEQDLDDRVIERSAELTQENARLLRELEARMTIERQLEASNRSLLSLQAAVAATVSCLDLGFVLETVTWEMTSLLDADGCLILAWDPGSDALSVLTAYGYSEGGEPVHDWEYDLEDYPLRHRVIVEQSIQQMTSGDPAIDPAEAAYMERVQARSLLIQPMSFQGRVVGLIEVKDSREQRLFSDQECSMTQLLANQAAAALENARLYEQAQREIKERIRAELQIKASLEEKEVLLKEMHHRVKNNLQVICSLLNLQSRSGRDREIAEIFRESQNRIRSMALIHERLYRSPDMAHVPFGEYIQNLVQSLVRSYRDRADSASVNVDAADILLPIDTAVPCGLILNELISNALKHAFPAGRSGQIQISLRRADRGRIELVVADDGIGLPEGLDIGRSDSLGLKLIVGLVEQIEGALEWNGVGGTECRVTFGAT